MRQTEAAGRRPYLIPVGASNEIGAIGFVAAIEELDGQLKEQRIQADRIVFASSSGGTQAGLCAGAKAIGFHAQLAAIAIDSSRAELGDEVADIAVPTLRRLGLDPSFSPEEATVYDGYLGAGYAIMGEPEREAIELMARYEGILLDPVYTGRAMAGLIDLIRRASSARTRPSSSGTPAARRPCSPTPSNCCLEVNGAGCLFYYCTNRNNTSERPSTLYRRPPLVWRCRPPGTASRVSTIGSQRAFAG